ncbi:MAG: T9SS type A sorting domain-containing protein [Bacteroidales bacterium]|nr:T9SS type A sorting domain-containing protein [Bacteroidales bacterium]
MKKALLLIIACTVSFMVLSQERRVVMPKSLTDQGIIRHQGTPMWDEGRYVQPYNPLVQQGGTALEEFQIGTTWYDLQSNSLLSNRIWLHDDGTIGAVWTMGFESAAFNDRGTGYNFYDGNAWGPQPTARIESLRTGWPSYAAWGEDGEIVVSHDFDPGRLVMLSRAQKGTGTWSESFLNGPDTYQISWPRMTTSGSNHEIIHVLYSTWPVANGGTPYMGQDGAMLYSRSTDGGTTWDPLHQVLEGTGATYYNSISADEYAFAEPRAGVIAFVCADAWHDMFALKSTDDGDTWEKLLIWEHPYPFFDWNTTITTDTIWAPDNSADIAVDNNGMVHVVFGITRVAHTEVGTTYSYWPYTDGIGYWNETMPPFTDPLGNQHDALDAWDVLIGDYNLVGWEQDVNNNGVIDLLADIMAYRELSLTTMPEISVGPLNQLFVAFAATTETYDNGTYNYKHIWMRTSPDGGTTWGNFYDLNTDLIHIFDECIYPVMAGSVDEYVHLIYNADATPGTALDENHPYQENRMIYVRENVNLLVGMDTETLPLESTLVSQNYPNPFKERTVIQVTIREASPLVIELLNLMGQTVRTIDQGWNQAGTHLISIEASGMDPGVYFYRVMTGNSIVTRKMIIE